MKITKFAVIGHPIEHTMSPFIHKRLFTLSGYKPSYDVLNIKDVVENKELLLSYDGLNVTIPHKSAIMNIAHSVADDAIRYNSANTIKNDNGVLSAYTTDGIGCITAIENAGVKIEGTVIILGTGGAARAIAFALEPYRVKIIIAARDKDKARLLSEKINNSDYLSITECEASMSAQLLINATSVGMYPNGDDCVVGKDFIGRCDSVFDAVYNPHDTVLLKTAKSLNKKIIYGIDMLVFQAVVAHKIWYCAEFNKSDILKLCEDSKNECCRLFDNYSK